MIARAMLRTPPATSRAEVSLTGFGKLNSLRTAGSGRVVIPTEMVGHAAWNTRPVQSYRAEELIPHQHRGDDRTYGDIHDRHKGAPTLSRKAELLAVRHRRPERTPETSRCGQHDGGQGDQHEQAEP